MQHRILPLPDIQDSAHPSPVISLSFRPFLDYIRERLNDSDTIKKEIYQLILHRFSKYPELEAEVKLEDTGNYIDLLNLLYIALSTVVEDEKNVLWGISTPVTPVIFYGSDPLYNLMYEAANNQVNPEIFANPKEFNRQKYEMIYSF